MRKLRERESGLSGGYIKKIKLQRKEQMNNYGLGTVIIDGSKRVKWAANELFILIRESIKLREQMAE